MARWNIGHCDNFRGLLDVSFVPGGSDPTSIRQSIFNANFPETLFAFGIPGCYVLPPDPKVINTRMLMAFTNVHLLSYADTSVAPCSRVMYFS